MPAAEY